jgi:glutathione synthase/RimK-type ligase-like ATP-grasp enzyme
MKFYVLDERDVWFTDIIRAATARGFDAQRILKAEEVSEPGYGFIRCAADPAVLEKNQRDWDLMTSKLSMIQDEAQVRLYENKSGQFGRWASWMPETWRFTDYEAARTFIEGAEYPLVSKADVGASSINVRIIPTREEGLKHIALLFGEGISVHHCTGTLRTMQRGYVLLQRFIPHRVTWRVNALGTKRAAFMRYCYADRAVAQTGNVEPVMRITPQVESLLEFCNRFFDAANTKWCAIDVLQENDKWWLLETSLAWPWPSPGKCNEAPIFGTKRTWWQMFDLMMDEVESGTWPKPSAVSSS